MSAEDWARWWHDLDEIEAYAIDISVSQVAAQRDE